MQFLEPLNRTKWPPSTEGSLGLGKVPGRSDVHASAPRSTLQGSCCPYPRVNQTSDAHSISSTLKRTWTRARRLSCRFHLSTGDTSQRGFHRRLGESTRQF